MLTTTKKMLAAADKGGYAVGAFNFNNLEMLQAIIEAATDAKAPVIVQTSEGAIEYAGMDYLVAMANVAAKAKISVALHLDHGKNLDIIKSAIKSGYTSVMFDGSLLPYEENIATTRAVVRWAKKRGVSVEAELGAIKGVEDLVSVEEKQAFFTDPSQARDFVERTGCDSLAVSVGTAHGAFKFKSQAELDITRLKQIDAAVKVPLVLHGASGISPKMLAELSRDAARLGDANRVAGASGVPDAEIKKAIKSGVRKINIDSDLRLAFTAGFRRAALDEVKTIDPRKLLAMPKLLMRQTVTRKLNLFGSSGKA